MIEAIASSFILKTCQTLGGSTMTKRFLSRFILFAVFILLPAQARTATGLIDFGALESLGQATSSDAILTIDASVPAWKKVTFMADATYYLDGTGQWSIPPGGDGTVLPECTAGQMYQFDGTDIVCIATPSPTFDPYTAGENIDITSGEISVTGLNLADISDAGAAAYLNASNGTIGDVAVWVGVCSDTSFTDSSTCIANGGTWNAALPISVGAAEVEDSGSKFSSVTLAGILQEIGGRVENLEDGTTPVSITEQSADPTAGAMTTGEIIVATTSGDMFYKSATGLYTFTGTYAADGSTCSTPTTGNILNEGFEGTGYENSGYWESSGTVDPDHTHSGTPPTNSCAQALQVVASGSSSYIQKDLGSALTYPVTVAFSMYLDSATIAQYDSLDILASWTGTWGTGPGNLRVMNMSSGTPEYILRHIGSVNSANIPIDLDTWYDVEITYASTESSSSITVGSTTEGFTRNSNAMQIIRLGAESVSSTEAATIELDLFHIGDGS